MNFYLLGIDHKKTPIDVREAVYLEREAIGAFWRGHGRAAIFSTCNRFEIYVVSEDAFSAGVALDIFRDRFSPLFDNAYFIYKEKDVFRHLVRLAAGLESQIRGELQIFGQLSAWLDKESLPASLSALVKDALLAAHDLRMKNGLNRPENNIAVAVYDKILSTTRPNALLDITVVGTGKIAELFAKYRPHGVRLHFAAHKNILRSKELAKIAQGESLLLEGLPELLLKTDVLISATSSPHRVFDKEYFSKIAASRERELYIYDLALPRDIDPEVRDINGIILRNMDEVISDAKFKSWHKAEQISR